jgi:hypothetical protein
VVVRGPIFLLWLILLICYPEKLLSPWEIGDLCFGALIFGGNPLLFCQQSVEYYSLCQFMCLSGISNVGVAKSGDGLPLCSPYSLDVSRCIKLSDRGLKAVALGCQKLRQLHITGCKLITDNLSIVLS